MTRYLIVQGPARLDREASEGRHIEAGLESQLVCEPGAVPQLEPVRQLAVVHHTKQPAHPSGLPIQLIMMTYSMLQLDAKNLSCRSSG